MTPEQHRECAAEIMRYNAGKADPMVVGEQVDYFKSIRNLPFSPDHDVTRVVDLIRDATVTITWPAPCPACGVIGCTEHPTWAAESEPEVPRWSTPDKRGRLIYDWQARDEEPFDLTAAQEIRLRLTCAVLSSDGYVGVPNLAADVTAVVLPLAQMVETGEPSSQPDPYRPSALIPRPAGYSETLRVPGYSKTRSEGSGTVVTTGSGLSDIPVVTAQDPGGLLSEPAAFVDPATATVGWERIEGSLPSEAPKEGDDA